MFGFASDDYEVLTNTFTNDGDEFYISSFSTLPSTREVPIPAAIWLMGSALGGLGFMRRKKAQA